MIKNKSNITYTIEKLEYILNSNEVIVCRVKPIITFKKCVNKCGVRILIYNNSGIDLKNVELFNNFSNTLENSIYINCDLYENDICLNVIRLGDIKNGEFISICYKIKEKDNSKALLKYDISLNNRKSTFFLASN
jgi:hypothetical protein